LRKILIPVIALIALFGVVAVASADSENGNHSKIFFFGHCEEQITSTDVSGAGLFGHGCRGFGIFWGHWDHDSMVEQIAYKAGYKFGGDWEVTKFHAINVFGGAPLTGASYGCEEPGGLQTNVVTNEVNGIPGLWIAWFKVEPCDPYYEE
jgi:hypothetical protein